MSATSSTTETYVHAGASTPALVVATMKRWWLAYITWRIEHTALATLNSMSDRELTDIGLGRSDIIGAVKGETVRGGQ